MALMAPMRKMANNKFPQWRASGQEIYIKMRKLFNLLVPIITLGSFGDFHFLRKCALKFPFLRWVYFFYCKKHCASIPLECSLADNVIFPHNIYGCFFSINARIGSDCTILHHVTIGNNLEKKYSDYGSWGSPTIGNKVFIGAGAKIIGKITIGDKAKIGAGCVVVQDVPAGATCVMQNSRIIVKNQNA